MVDVPVKLQQLPINTFSLKAWTLPGYSTRLTKQPWFIIWPVQVVSLGTARWIEHAICATLRNLLGPQTATHLGDRSPRPLGPYPFPFTASFKISMSRACLATIFFNWTLSFHRALSSFTISGCLPPYFCCQRW